MYVRLMFACIFTVRDLDWNFSRTPRAVFVDQLLAFLQDPPFADHKQPLTYRFR